MRPLDMHKLASWLATAALVAASLTVVGCTKRNPDICCDSVAECTKAGLDANQGLAHCEDGVCVNYTCVASGCDDDGDCHDPAHPTCVSGQCYGPVDACREGGGARIVFYSTRDDRGLYNMYIKGGSPKFLTSRMLQSNDVINYDYAHDYGYFNANMSPSPDGTAVAFIGSAPNGVASVFTINTDGTNLQQITDGTQVEDHVAWSPDGAKIAVSAVQNNTSAVASVIRIDGSHGVKLYGSGSTYEPIWSHDSKMVSYVSVPSTHSYSIWVSNDNGSLPSEFVLHDDTDSSYELHRPRLSPDGARMSYIYLNTSFGFPGGYLYITPLSKEASTLVSGSIGDDVESEWSHDGTQIAFVRSRGVWVANADGSAPHVLTPTGTVNRHPRWSADDSHILFDTSRDGNDEVYVMDRDGSNPRNLTNFAGPDDAISNDYSAEWASCPTN